MSRTSSAFATLAASPKTSSAVFRSPSSASSADSGGSSAAATLEDPSTPFSASSAATSVVKTRRSRLRRSGAHATAGTGQRPRASFFETKERLCSSLDWASIAFSAGAGTAAAGGSGATFPASRSDWNARAASRAISALLSIASSMARGSCAALISGSSRAPRSKSRRRNASACSCLYCSYRRSASAGVAASETCRTQNSRKLSGSSSRAGPRPRPRPRTTTRRPSWKPPPGGPSKRRRRGERSRSRARSG